MGEERSAKRPSLLTSKSGGGVVFLSRVCTLGTFFNPGAPAFEWACLPLNLRVARSWRWRRQQLIKVLEVRATATLFIRCARSGPPHENVSPGTLLRLLLLIVKGQSSSRQLNRPIRAASMICLTIGPFVSYVYVQSAYNHADELKRLGP